MFGKETIGKVLNGLVDCWQAPMRDGANLVIEGMAFIDKSIDKSQARLAEVTENRPAPEAPRATVKAGEKTVNYYGDRPIADFKIVGNGSKVNGDVTVRGFKPRAGPDGEEMQLVQVVYPPTEVEGKTDVSWVVLVKRQDGSALTGLVTAEQAQGIKDGSKDVQLGEGFTQYTESKSMGKRARGPAKVVANNYGGEFPPLPQAASH